MEERDEQKHIQTLSEFIMLHENYAETFGHTIKFVQHFLFILKGFYTQKKSLFDSVHSLYDVARDIRNTLEEISTKQGLTEKSIISMDNVQKCLDEILIELDFYRLDDETGESQNVIKKQHIENLIVLTAEKTVIPQKMHGTILLLDRNPNTQTSLSFRLENEGHEVLVAKSSSEARMLLQHHDVDLLIIDEFTLHHATQELFDFCIDEKNYTIIVVIGHADNSQLIATSSIKGAEDFIPKPVNNELLKARVLSALEKRQIFLHRLQKLYTIRETITEIENSMESAEDAVLLISHDLTIENHNGKIFDIFPPLAEEFQSQSHDLYLKDIHLTSLYTANFKHDMFDRNYHSDVDTHIKDITGRLLKNDGSWTEHLSDGRVLEYKFLTSFDNKKVVVIKDTSNYVIRIPLPILRTTIA